MSTNQAAPYSSPKAENFNQGVADLEMLSQLENELETASGSWIGQIAEASHRLLLGMSDGKATTWYHALGNFPHSGVFLWPGKLASTKTRHGTITWFIHDKGVEAMVIKPLCALGQVKACTFRWRSVLCQSRHLPDSHRPKAPRILPVIEEGPGPLVVVAAKEAFWSMTKTQVIYLAKLVGVMTDPGATLHAVLLTVVKAICNCSDAEALHITSTRLAVKDVSASFADALLDIHEAAQVMDKGDVRLLKVEQDKESVNKDEHADFANDFRYSMERHRAAQPAGRADRGRRQPNRDIPERVTHQEAKGMASPGCFVWRGLRSQPWCAIVPRGGGFQHQLWRWETGKPWQMSSKGFGCNI